MPDSLFSKLSEASEAETFITEPDLMRTHALVLSGPSKGESTEELPAFLFDLTPDYSRESKTALHRRHTLLTDWRSPPPNPRGPNFSIPYPRF